MKRPAFQFYPGDWRKDVELRSCSLSARGLWVDLLCVAHECEPYGHLMVNGRPMTPAQIAGQIGVPAAHVQKLLAELLDNGVARKTEEGAIYSKRMVNDERIRNARAEGGKAGSEYGVKGAEHGSKGGRPPKARGVSEPPLEPPPSSSSSSSASTTSGAIAPEGDRRKPRGTRKLPASFELTDELRAWAATEAPRANVDREFAKLADHEFAKAHSDWPAVFRNWMRRASDDKPALRAVGGQPAEPAWRTEQRGRMNEALGPYATSRRVVPETVEMEAQDAPRILG